MVWILFCGFLSGVATVWCLIRMTWDVHQGTGALTPSVDSVLCRLLVCG